MKSKLGGLKSSKSSDDITRFFENSPIDLKFCNCSLSSICGILLEFQQKISIHNDHHRWTSKVKFFNFPCTVGEMRPWQVIPYQEVYFYFLSHQSCMKNKVGGLKSSKSLNHITRFLVGRLFDLIFWH